MNMCENCVYYYKTEYDDFPCCHCTEPEGWAPCEYEDEKWRKNK